MRVIYKQFAQLCESMMCEDSAALRNPVVNSSPLATALVKKLHDMRWLPHDAELTPYTFTKLSALSVGSSPNVKKSQIVNPEHLLVLPGEYGAAAILVKPYEYKAYIVRKARERDDPEKIGKDGYYYNGYKTTDWKSLQVLLRSDIGRVSKNMLRASTRAVTKLRGDTETKERSKKSEISTSRAILQLLIRFKPVFKKNLVQAIAYMHENARQALKYHNYEPSRAAINRSNTLYRILNELDNIDMNDTALVTNITASGGFTLLGKAINTALITAAMLNKADAIKNATKHNVESEIEVLRSKFPKSWSSVGSAT